MTKVQTTTTSFTLGLSLALAMTAPAHAHGFGGGLGGGLGGGFGGGLPVGGIMGNAGIGGSIDAAGGTFRSTSTVSEHTTTRTPKTPKAPKAPKVATTALTTKPNAATPSLSTAPVARDVAAVHGRVMTTADRVDKRVVTAGSAIERETTQVVYVPAIPDYAARRTAIIASGIAPIAYDDAPAYIDTQYQTLQNDLRGTGVDVVRRGQQIVLEMPGDVTFAFDKYDIQPRFRPVLDAVAQTLSKYSASYIDVDGHTDAIGSMAYNQRLSEQRAFTVADYLSARAVAPVRMHVEGFGKTEPIASNATVAGRAANRRVEIVLTPYVG